MMTNRGSGSFELCVAFHLKAEAYGNSEVQREVRLSFNEPADRDAYWLVNHTHFRLATMAPVLHLPGRSAKDSVDIFVHQVKTAAEAVMVDIGAGDTRYIECAMWQHSERWSAFVHTHRKTLPAPSGLDAYVTALKVMQTLLTRNPQKRMTEALLDLIQMQLQQHKEEDEAKDEDDGEPPRKRVRFAAAAPETTSEPATGEKEKEEDDRPPTVHAAEGVEQAEKVKEEARPQPVHDAENANQAAERKAEEEEEDKPQRGHDAEAVGEQVGDVNELLDPARESMVPAQEFATCTQSN